MPKHIKKVIKLERGNEYKEGRMNINERIKKERKELAELKVK